MRYQDDPPLEGLDRGGEAVDRVDVQVVGRLVEQQHPARLRSEHGEDEPRALAIGHQAYGRGLLLGAEAEGGEVRAPHLLAPLVLRRREGAAHEDERRYREMQGDGGDRGDIGEITCGGGKVRRMKTRGEASRSSTSAECWW